MTEEEAKTKWCPYARVYSQNYITGEGSCSGGWNRHPEDRGDIPRCIGSACMAWRWDRSEQEREDRMMNPAIDPNDEETYAAYNREIPITDGYCGLAGKL